MTKQGIKGGGMREIKFRAWDKEHKCWHETELKFYGFHLFGECTLICPPRAEDLQHLEITQFTGLKDKNGVEIYEGDIVELDDIRCPITFDDGAFQMITSSNQGRPPAMQERLKKWEVIGNIYESPELLKGA